MQSIREGENVSYHKRYHKQSRETNKQEKNICKQDMNQKEQINNPNIKLQTISNLQKWKCRWSVSK